MFTCKSVFVVSTAKFISGYSMVRYVVIITLKPFTVIAVYSSQNFVDTLRFFFILRSFKPVDSGLH